MPRKINVILIVEDHADTRRAVARLLQSEGYECVGVENGMQALLFMETALPRLVILDGMMPDLDGLEVLRRMKQDARLSAVPVLFYSADAGPERVEAAMRLGAIEFIVKGSTFGVLLCQVEKYCGPRPAQPDPRPSSSR